MNAPVITVDGPSGVGKGMVTRWLANTLGWARLDSGALYRILALAAQRAGVPLDEDRAVAALAADLDIRFLGKDEADEQILINGEDWHRAVRDEATGGLASKIAVFPSVRNALLARQRAFRQLPGLIGDGRDMGTVIFPDAPLKIYLEATPMERAQRRLAQLNAAGSSAILADLCEEIAARDERDRTRTVAPLVPAADAIRLDTSGLDREDVLEKIAALVKSHGWLN